MELLLVLFFMLMNMLPWLVFIAILIFIFLATCSDTAEAQVVIDNRPSVVITDRPAPAPVVHSPPESERLPEPPANPPEPEPSTPFAEVSPTPSEPISTCLAGYPDYVVMYTATWCGVCKSPANLRNIAAIEKAGTKVYLLDVDAKPERKQHASRLPCFYVVDGNTHTLKVGPWIGVTPPETILAPVRVNPLAMQKWIRRTFDPKDQNTWDDVKPRSNVWNHLCDGSGGNHSYLPSEVRHLSQWEALALHHAVHRGLVPPEFIPGSP
jgi:hypothetical protein